MKIRSFCMMLLLLLAAANALAGEVREIELADGSIVAGEVLSLTDGVYTIRTRSLGTISVPEQDIRAIRQQGTVSSSPPAGAAADETQSLQMRMMNDQEIMSLIESLRNDPDFQKVLQDPDIMRAVNAGDVAALSANPRFLKLLQNATVQDIQRKVGQ